MKKKLFPFNRSETKKNKYRKARKVAQKQVSALGKLIDLPLDQFQSEIEQEQVNVGQCHTLILNLEAMYAELRGRKDLLVERSVSADDKEKREIEKAVESVYAELFKIEQKVTYLKEREKTLLDSVNGELTP